VEKFHDLFVASTGAAAAFIGLLFVAISIAPENVFGTVARREKHVRAQRAFLALGNVFFISLFALIPGVSWKPFVVVALMTLYQILRDTFKSFKDEPGWQNWRQWGLLSLIAYVFEIYQSFHIEQSPIGIVWTVAALYFYGLFSAWTLLQAKTEQDLVDAEAEDGTT
jgi:hypothetical protein